MNNINTTYDELADNVSDLLTGTISPNSDLIRWEYDAVGLYLDSDELMEVYYEDVEIILDNSSIDETKIGEPHIERDFISFYIEI